MTSFFGPTRIVSGAGARDDRNRRPRPDDVARLVDPWGNLWWVHERVEDVAVEEMVRRLGDPAVHATMAAYEESLDAEMRRRSG